MVSNTNQTTLDSPVNQGVRADIPEPNKIGASTHYDFDARNLTAYEGLLPVATMLEKLRFQQLVEETLTVKRQTRSMPMLTGEVSERVLRNGANHGLLILAKALPGASGSLALERMRKKVVSRALGGVFFRHRASKMEIPVESR